MASLKFIPIMIVTVLIINSSSNTTNLPFGLESDCCVNFVIRNGPENYDISNIKNDQKKYLENFNFAGANYSTFIIKQRGTISDVIEVVEITEDNIEITTNDRYFRYQVKHRSSCTIFVLLTEDFQDTTMAIHESGYGKASNVPFFIYTSNLFKENALIWSFENDLFSSDWEHAFHASIVFFDNYSNFGVLCYFCPDNSGKLHLINGDSGLIPSSNITAAATFNQRGHGKGLRLGHVSSFPWSTKSKCLNPKIDKDRTLLYDALINCYPTELPIFAIMQNTLNITIVQSTDLISEQQKREMEWFLHIHFAEGMVASVPNVYLFTRGSYIIQQGYSLEFIACKDYQAMYTLDVLLRTIMDPAVWLAVITLAVAYAYTFKDASLGVHFVWLFLGVHDTNRHSRNRNCFVVLSVGVLGYIFQGYINTDAMYMNKFPTFVQLTDLGYRVWLMAGDIEILRTVIPSLSKSTRNIYEAIQGVAGGDLLKILHSEEDPDYQYPVDNSYEKFIDALSKRKLMAPCQDHSSLCTRIGTGVKDILNGRFVCLVIDMRTALKIHIDISLGFRVYGYLAERASWAIGKWLQMGFFDHWNKLTYFLYRVGWGNSLEVKDTDTFLRPRAVPIKSEIGVKIIYLVVFQSILVLVRVVSKVESVAKEGRMPKCILGKDDTRECQEATLVTVQPDIIGNGE